MSGFASFSPQVCFPSVSAGSPGRSAALPPALLWSSPPWQNGAAPSAYSSSTAVTVPVMSSSSPFMAFSSNPSPLTLMSSFPPLTMISSRP